MFIYALTRHVRKLKCIAFKILKQSNTDSCSSISSDYLSKVCLFPCRCSTSRSKLWPLHINSLKILRWKSHKIYCTYMHIGIWLHRHTKCSFPDTKNDIPVRGHLCTYRLQKQFCEFSQKKYTYMYRCKHVTGMLTQIWAFTCNCTCKQL